MSLEFEDYLTGNLSEEERKALEKRLAENPALEAQMQEEKELLARLKGQMLRERVEAAMKTGRQGPQRPSFPPRWLWGALVAFLALLLIWWMWYRPEKGVPQEAPVLEQPAVPERDNEKALPPTEPAAGQEQPQESISGPIARQARPSGPAESPQSGLRGGSPANVLGQQAVLQFALPGTPSSYPIALQAAAGQIRQGKFGEASRMLAALEQQGAGGDTLIFLQGFSLLKQEQGMEAARYFIRLEGAGGAFEAQAQWGHALSWLLAGQETWAAEQLRLIAGQAGHPWAEEARSMLEKLNAGN